MTFAIESLGCAKNQVDSEELIAALEEAGHRWVAGPEEAELLVVNTCGFITSAKEESIQVSLELKSRYPGKLVVATGCLVARHGRELAESLTELDGFVADRRPEAMLRVLARLHPRDGAARHALRRRPAASSRRLLSYPGSAYVKVAEGCSNHCSYCAIPLIRGELASRTVAEVVEEVRGLLDRGILEMNLIAQDLASFGSERGRAELARLLEELTRLPGRFWIRLLYLHPDHFPEPILELFAADRRLLPYFDIPFQHASRPVLERMGRRGEAGSYLAFLERLRARLPEAVIRSTFLVGFPGETEEDFRALVDFQRAARLDWAGVFTWSREEGTPAYGLPGRVPARRARDRRDVLQREQIPITEARLERHVGRVLPVLIEERVHGEPLALGRAYLQAPEVDGLTVVRGNHLTAGAPVRARILRRNGVDLEAVALAGGAEPS